MAFPTTDMAGHQRLKERAEAVLNRAVEASDVEFKVSAPWDALQWNILKTVLGMGNLRDGGLIVVGLSEAQATWQLDGISPPDLASFDADKIAAAFEKYVSPAPAVEVVLHYRGDKVFLVFDIGEFEEIPFVCRRNGPADSRLEVAGFYHRPLGGVPRTERVRSVEDMRPILQVAAEKGARRLLEQAGRVGLLEPPNPPISDDIMYDAELGDL